MRAKRTCTAFSASKWRFTSGQPPGNAAVVMTDKAVIHVPVKTILIPLVVTRPHRGQYIGAGSTLAQTNIETFTHV